MLDPRFGFRTGWFERALTVCAAGMLLGLGLCGSLMLTHTSRFAGTIARSGRGALLRVAGRFAAGGFGEVGPGDCGDI